MGSRRRGRRTPKASRGRHPSRDDHKFAESPTYIGEVGHPGPTCCVHSFAPSAAGDSTPTGTGRHPLAGRETKTLAKARYRSLQVGRSHRTPSGAANGLATGHTRNKVRGHWKAFHGHCGTCSSEVSLLRCSRCIHPTRHASVPEPARR